MRSVMEQYFSGNAALLQQQIPLPHTYSNSTQAFIITKPAQTGAMNQSQPEIRKKVSQMQQEASGKLTSSQDDI